MTPKAPTTWIVGLAAAAVIAGVAVAAWPWMVERWYAARFADTELSVQERQQAANRLAGMRSPLLIERIVELVAGQFQEESYSEHNGLVLGFTEELVRGWTSSDVRRDVAFLVRVLAEGSRYERLAAAGVLASFEMDALLYAGQVVLDGCRSEDRGMQQFHATTLAFGCDEWAHNQVGDGTRPTIEEFAARFDLLPDDVYAAISALGNVASGRRAAADFVSNFELTPRIRALLPADFQYAEPGDLRRRRQSFRDAIRRSDANRNSPDRTGGNRSP